jgi:hypothetical protein
MAVTAALAEADRQAHVVHESFSLIRTSGLADKRRKLLELKYRLARLKVELDNNVDENSEQSADAAKLATVDALLTSIGSFETIIATTPEGASRSLLTTALMQERLHSAEEKIQYVLLVKGRNGTSQQLVNDRPLMFNDKFSTVSSAGISFLLIEAEFGRVLVGGTKVASQFLSGSIGSEFTAKSVGAL